MGLLQTQRPVAASWGPHHLHAASWMIVHNVPRTTRPGVLHPVATLVSAPSTLMLPCEGGGTRALPPEEQTWSEPGLLPRPGPQSMSLEVASL
jgi:hypothetical protein